MSLIPSPSPHTQDFLEYFAEGQTVNLIDKNLIEPEGQLTELEQIGTNSSTGDYLFDLNQFGNNNHLKSSDVNFFAASIYSALWLRGSSETRAFHIRIIQI